MEHLVRRFLIIPIVIFFIALGAFFYFYEKYINNFINSNIQKQIDELKLKEKLRLKNDVNNFKNFIDVLKKRGLSEKEILKIVTKFLDRYNKDRVDYIAIGKIETFNPDNGVFGKVLYMPPKFRYLIGKPLSYNKPDIKGNYYRKKYFLCVKEGKSCFLTYYFKNPKTAKYEEKISYFTLYKPFNWVIMKGVYLSYLNKRIDELRYSIKSQIEETFRYFIFLFLGIFIVAMILYFYISRRISKKILDYYNKLYEEFLLSEERVFKKIYYDDLTSLPNRTKLIKDIKKYNSLVLIDLDEFSLINDIYGFEIGDEILKYVATLLKRKYPNVYRLGSDEFGIGFERKITAKFLEELSYTHIEYNQIPLSFTIGGSIKEDLLKTSELALKFAMNHKNRKYYLYDEHIFKLQEKYISQIHQLKSVLINESVIPFYQCIVDKDEKRVKYEALMRLKVDNEIKTPFEFMDLIKKAKIYELFTRIMLKKVIADLKENKLNEVSINISFEDISNEYTKKFILDHLTDEIAKRVTIEILESEGIENFEIVSKFIETLKRRGAKIAIDDFGSGYSNLVEVLMLNPDYIKIDASLIKNIDNKKYEEIVKLIIEFANKFNIKVVAEFVDSKEKFEKLKSLGVDYFQGYYFCKPVDINVITK